MTAATAKWSAIGTTALVQVADRSSLREAVVILDRQLRELDRAASSYREDSELTRVNRSGGRWTAVSPLLATLIEQGLRGARLSDGLVDPTAGSGDWRAIELALGGGLARLPSGAQLDLGATAKAFAADRAATAIERATGSSTLVSLGGDIATAGLAPAGGWRIRVSDDHRATLSAPGQTVTITGGALATSGTTVRRYTRDGTGAHHIIDPRTGTSATGRWRTVSAVAGTCVDANIATTAAIVLGDGAPAWLEAAGIAARLVAEDGAVTGVCGWPQDAPEEVAA